MLSLLVLAIFSFGGLAQDPTSFPKGATVVAGPEGSICTRASYNVTLPSYAITPFSNIDPSLNQTVLTGIINLAVTSFANFTAAYQSPSGLPASAFASSGSYLISGTLCTPLYENEHVGTVQLLVHGVGFDSEYWDWQYEPATYSYVWAAAAAGYTTFRFDRLGTGLSEYPSDGLNVVQAATDVEVLRSLASLLRTGGIGGVPYSKILLVGHSYGSFTGSALVSRYPSAVDGYIASGLTSYSGASSIYLADCNYGSAAQVSPYVFAGLPNTYLLPGSPQAMQMLYLWPDYDPAVFAYNMARLQPVSFGVRFTEQTIRSPALNFTGPVLSANGAHDVPECGGNCFAIQTGNQTILEATGAALFPAAKFSAYAAQLTGHNLNLHYSAPQTYKVLLQWARDNGF